MNTRIHPIDRPVPLRQFPVTVPGFHRVISRTARAAMNVLLALVVLVLVDSAGAQGQFTVSTTADNGPGSLRQAFADAEASPGADVITFIAGVNGQRITLTEEIIINDLTGGVTVDASALGAGITIAGDEHRVFYNSVDSIVGFAGVTITEGTGIGAASSGYGGAILNDGILTLTGCVLSNNRASGFAGYGGAILNNGVLTLTDCTLSHNWASGVAYGGAICNRGTLTLSRCTLFANRAPGNGGGIDNSGLLTADRCTFHGNFAGNIAGALSGIAGSEAHLTHCTIAGNLGSFYYTGIWMDHDDSKARMTMNYCIVADTITGNAYSGGHNLISDSPLLEPLGMYGGRTPTMALLPGSPARNAAIGSTALNDQRGFPIVGVPDIGAYEAGTASTFLTWAVENAGHAVAFTEDTEGDGVTNGLEYALRRNPLDSDSLSDPILAELPGSHTFTFRYQPAATDLRYIVQRSADLNAWINIFRFDTSTGRITENGVTGDIDNSAGSITVSDPANDEKLFWRLKIEKVD